MENCVSFYTNNTDNPTKVRIPVDSPAATTAATDTDTNGTIVDAPKLNVKKAGLWILGAIMLGAIVFAPTKKGEVE